MSIPVPGNIHPKFHPYIINHPSFKGPQKLKQEAANFFAAIRKDPNKLQWHQRAVQNLPPKVNQFLNWMGLAGPSTAQESLGGKPFITTSEALPGYVIKRQRTDHLANQVAPDALLYRVRKAEKIRTFLQAQGWESLVKVPHKYLYFDHEIGKWYLIAEKQENMLEVKSPLGINNFRVIQALAHLAFVAGLEDMHHENIRLGANSSAVILDTEPLSRGAVKWIRSFPLSRFWLDTSSVKVFFSMQSLGLLKQYVCQTNQKATVDQVAGSYLDAYFARTVLKIGAHIALFMLVGASLSAVPGVLGAKATVTVIRLSIQAKGGLLALQAVPNLCLFGLPRYVPKAKALWNKVPGNRLVNSLVGRVAHGIGQLPPSAKIAFAVIAWVATSLYVPYTMLSFPLKTIAGLTGVIGLLQLKIQREAQIAG